MNAKPRSLTALKLAALSFMAFSSAHAQVGSEAWVRRYSNTVDADDRARKVVTDNVGNVIVAGTSYDAINKSALLIIKCSAAGVPLWTNRYTYIELDIGGVGVGGLNVDSSGNVVVTGSQYTGYGSGNDFVTIKYCAAGMPLWTNFYNGPGNGDDFPFASAVDGSGNVVVTGYSHGVSGDLDYATIKYSSAGVPLWTNRYNGPSNGDDSPSAVAADGNGNIIVTGSSGTNFGTHGYTTIKYSSVGAPLWTNLYDSVGQPTAMALDDDGNVFVTGASTGGFGTIAYSGAGVPLWTNVYNSFPGNNAQATAIAVDSSGNVVVTGFSHGSWLFNDYATIKYSGAGVPLWTNRYHGPGNGDDRPIAVAVDINGNVLVTGNSTSSDGYLDYATVKYSSAGDPLWTNRYDGPASDDRAQSMSMDSSGNLVVTGYSLGIGGSYGFATVKYSNVGAALWTNRYNGLGNGTDGANAVAVDSGGNVVVTGVSYGVASKGDYLTIKYSSAGVPLWTNRYDGSGNSDDRPVAVVVDSSGSVFVTGYSIRNSGNNDSVTVAYSSAGAMLWTNQYDGQVNALGVDRSGNIVRHDP